MLKKLTPASVRKDFEHTATNHPISFHDHHHDGLPQAVHRSSSVIGKQISIKGDIEGTEDLFIDGAMTGHVKLKNHNLTIGRQGQVSANVMARIIIIEGSLIGDAFGKEQVIVRKSGQVRGNLVAARIIVEEGAIINGHIDMEKDTLAKYFPPEKIDDAETINIASKLNNDSRTSLNEFCETVESDDLES